MERYSQTVTDAIQDIRRTLEEQRQGKPRPSKPTSSSQQREIVGLVSEIVRLRTLLKIISVKYYELAEVAIEDPFGQSYEDVLAQLAVVKRVLTSSEERIRPYRHISE